jgi:hypothetical protein
VVGACGQYSFPLPGASFPLPQGHDDDLVEASLEMPSFGGTGHEREGVTIRIRRRSVSSEPSQELRLRRGQPMIAGQRTLLFDAPDSIERALEVAGHTSSPSSVRRASRRASVSSIRASSPQASIECGSSSTDNRARRIASHASSGRMSLRRSTRSPH